MPATADEALEAALIAEEYVGYSGGDYEVKSRFAYKAKIYLEIAILLEKEAA